MADAATSERKACQRAPLREEADAFPSGADVGTVLPVPPPAAAAPTAVAAARREETPRHGRHSPLRRGGEKKQRGLARLAFERTQTPYGRRGASRVAVPPLDAGPPVPRAAPPPSPPSRPAAIAAISAGR